MVSSGKVLAQKQEIDFVLACSADVFWARVHIFILRRLLGFGLSGLMSNIQITIQHGLSRVPFQNNARTAG